MMKATLLGVAATMGAMIVITLLPDRFFWTGSRVVLVMMLLTLLSLVIGLWKEFPK